MNIQYPQDFINKAVNMDCISAMKLIPDESVNCIVTSPPYWGLRDYGTATWIGGNPDCSHKRDSKHSESCNIGQKNLKDIGDGIYKSICKRCGAKRFDMQIGLEETPQGYVKRMVEVFAEAKRILRSDGTLWLNLGDTYSNYKDSKSTPQTMNKGYKSEQAHVIEKGKSPSRNTQLLKSAGLKNKDLVGIPWRVAFALQADGWYLRSDIIWHKENPMPESVRDRPTKSHEYIFLLTKSDKYYYDADSIREPHKEISLKRVKGNWNGKREDGEIKTSHLNMDIKKMCHEKGRNKRTVWTVNTESYPVSHFATFPKKLIEPCILAGCPEDGIVLDIFGGSGTTGEVSEKHNRNWIMIELNPKYIKLINDRTAQKSLFKQEI